MTHSTNTKRTLIFTERQKRSFIKDYEFDTMSRTTLYRDVTNKLLDLCEVGPSATIADVGCGSGLATAGLLDRYGDSVAAIVGVDPSEFELSIAKQRISHPKVKFVNGRAQDLKGFVGLVDTTVLSNVLHQIPSGERESVLAGCYDVLKIGGRCVFNTLFYDGAICPETLDFYGRWIFETNAWLRARGKQIEQYKSTPAARQIFSPIQHGEMLEHIGFSNIRVEEETYGWKADDWKALCRYSVFVEGATGLDDIPLGSNALIAAIDATFAGLKLTTVPRKWLFACATKRR